MLKYLEKMVKPLCNYRIVMYLGVNKYIFALNNLKT